MEGKVEQAAEYANRAMALAPNSALVLTQCSWAYVYNGESERTITCNSKARRLDPLDPRRGTTITAVGVAHFFARRFDECVQVMSRVVEENPTIMSAWRFLAAAHAHLGQSDLAQQAVARLLERQPSSTVTRIAKTSKFRHPWMVDLYLTGLRAAGLPE
jgi:adenylate cyclase